MQVARDRPSFALLPALPLVLTVSLSCSPTYYTAEQGTALRIELQCGGNPESAGKSYALLEACEHGDPKNCCIFESCLTAEVQSELISRHMKACPTRSTLRWERVREVFRSIPLEAARPRIAKLRAECAGTGFLEEYNNKHLCVSKGHNSGCLPAPSCEKVFDNLLAVLSGGVVDEPDDPPTAERRAVHARHMAFWIKRTDYLRARVERELSEGQPAARAAVEKSQAQRQSCLRFNELRDLYLAELPRLVAERYDALKAQKEIEIAAWKKNPSHRECTISGQTPYDRIAASMQPSTDHHVRAMDIALMQALIHAITGGKSCSTIDHPKPEMPSRERFIDYTRTRLEQELGPKVDCKSEEAARIRGIERRQSEIRLTPGFSWPPELRDDKMPPDATAWFDDGT